MQLGEEAYWAWLNQYPIQLPLRSSSPIRNSYIDSSCSHVENGTNEVNVGMDELLQQRSSMDSNFFLTF